jgi:uncharacterized membrane protein YdjX (TVP38/TMEM64 family)
MTTTLGPTREVTELKRWLNERATLLRGTSAVLSVLSILAIYWAAPVREILEWLRSDGTAFDLVGAAMFVAAFVALTACCLPVWIMPVLAGAMFGAWRGAAIASGSCVLAAAVTFAGGRFVAGTALRTRLHSSPRLRALERTASEADWRLVAAVRVSHFLPFGLQNYALGLTSIRFPSYVLATWIATLPGIVLQAYIGDVGYLSVESWQDQALAKWQEWTLRGIALLVIGCAILYLGWLWRSRYGRILKEELNRQIQTESGDDTKRTLWPIDVIYFAGVTLILVTIAVTATAWRYTHAGSLQRARSPGDPQSSRLVAPVEIHRIGSHVVNETAGPP